MPIAVQTVRICKDFPAGDRMLRVLHDIEITLEAGQLTMLVGPSGCGKTTLLSIISGILSPTEGEVLIADTHLTTLSDKEKVLFRRKNLGFIFQQFNLLPALTAAENAAVSLLAGGMDFDKAVQKATAALAKVGIDDFQASKLPTELSGGQQQRVAFARAIVHEPKVIVCDEPTSALDGQTGQQVMSTLREIALHPDCAVIVVSHDPRIYRFADRIIKMNDGRIQSHDFNPEDETEE